MATNTKHIVLASGGRKAHVYVTIGYGTLTLAGREIQILDPEADALFVYPPLTPAVDTDSAITHDLSSTGPGKATIYFEGRQPDYTLTPAGTNVHLTRKTTVGCAQTVVVARGTARHSDQLVFADGTICAYAAYQQATARAGDFTHSLPDEAGLHTSPIRLASSAASAREETSSLR